MHYKLSQKFQINSKASPKLLSGMIVGAAILTVPAIPALAASNSYCGSSANGCAAAIEAGAQCDSGAGSGAFGAFGPGNDWSGGANGHDTGLANSSLCGNRQGNL